jgi:uncharacterized protein YneF (UPF0154 family)
MENSNSEYLIGNLLIKKGYIDYHQLSKALEFQSKLSQRDYAPIGEILVRIGIITREVLSEVLNIQAELRTKSYPEEDNKIFNSIPSTSPRMSVSPKFISTSNKILAKPTPPTEQKIVPEPPIVKKIDTLSKPSIPNSPIRKPLGEILVEKNFITKEQLQKTLNYQAELNSKGVHKTLGEILLEFNYVTREQINLAVKAQPPVNPNSIEEIAKKMGFVNEAELSAILRQLHAVGNNSISIGDLLLQHGFINKEQLDQILKTQKPNL